MGIMASQLIDKLTFNSTAYSGWQQTKRSRATY